MAAEDVARALMAMEDDASVCSRLAQGDTGAVADLRLSADELALVAFECLQQDGQQRCRQRLQCFGRRHPGWG